jgi:hypothetical protein
MRVRSLSVLVREFAMFLSGRRMVLGLLVLAALVMVLGLMMVMGCSVVVASRGVVMLTRRMFCHFSVLQLHRFGSDGDAILRYSRSWGTALKIAHLAYLGNGPCFRF